MTEDIAGRIDRDALAEWAQRFVRYPSPQTDLFEKEPAVLGFIEECAAPLIADLGLPARRDRMGDLIVEIGPEGTGRSLMFMAYAMTHPAASMRDPFAGEMMETPAGRAVRGRGVSEQKGALAAALAALAAAAKGTLGGRLVFALTTAGETGRHDAAAAVLEALGEVPRLGVVVIGTTSRVSLGNKGRIDVEMRVGGRAAHSGMPWAGVDAIEGARRVLDQIAGLALASRLHPALGKPTLTVTRIESFPKATHTVQEEVRLTLDRRLMPGDDPEAALAEIRAAVALPEPWTLEIEPGPLMYPCEIAEDGALVRAIDAGAALAGLPASGRFYSHGALDAGFLARAGCEAAMWGPGAVESWHSDEETLGVSELFDGARAYAGLIAASLG